MSLIHGTGNRPGCWGRADVYDADNKECRGCGFQETCRSQVIKTISAHQVAVPQVSNVPQYSPQYPGFPQQQQQYAVPQQTQQAPVWQPQQLQPRAFVPAPTYAAPTRVGPPQPVPPAPVPQQQVQPQPGMVPADWYGRMQDPLFFQILSPPPFRGQMQGETFMERVGKNMLLDLGTMAFFHLGLAMRQMFLPPQPVLPREKDVTPR